MSSVMRFDEWQDSNGNPVASGVGGVFTAPGSVLQVQSTTKLDTFSTTSSTMTDITGLSVSVTPKSTSSKVMVIASMIIGADVNRDVRLNLVRNSTALAVPTTGTFGNQTTFAFPYTLYDMTTSVITYLDSPSTTSATTYKVQMAMPAGTGYVNRRSDTYFGTSSTITVMEIAG